MRLAIGSDHAGFKLKSQLVSWLKSRSGGHHLVNDVGTTSPESCDYPDFAARVAQAVSKGRVSRGILLCGTGIGMAMAANKIRGVRAAVAWDPAIAALASKHNRANVLCLPARFIGLGKARAAIAAYLKTPYGTGRHARRVRKITDLDRCA
jgi:ribose 5-phosphate isomerase B